MAQEGINQDQTRGNLAEEVVNQDEENDHLAEVGEPPGPYGDHTQSTIQRVVKTTVSGSRRGRQAWTDDECKYLKTKFRYYLAGARTSVHNTDMLAAQEEYPGLRRRTLAQIRAKLNNIKLGKSN